MMARLLLLLPIVAAWRPDHAALEAARGETVRCLHREGKSNAFFQFYDSEDEAAAYAQATPTEADAIDVTDQVTGYNVEFLREAATQGEWTVEFYVMCGAGYPCDDGDVNALPADDYEFLEYPLRRLYPRPPVPRPIGTSRRT